MKVLHLVATSEGWGGLETIVCAIATEQSRQGFDVLVAGNEEVARRLPDSMARSFDFAKSRYNPSLIYSLVRLIQREKITILHAHANKGAALAKVLRRFLPKLITVATIHNTKKRVAMFRGHDAVTAVSRMSAEALKPIPAEVVRNGLALPEVTRPSDGFPERKVGRKLLGSYGRLVPAKGLDLLIPLMKKLPETELWLLGEGPEEQKLRELAEAEGVADRVWFGGFRNDACEVMKEVDLFVMASRHEGFPLTLIEMLHREVPLVATRVAGAEEILPEEVTCPVEDSAALLLLIQEALSEGAQWASRLKPAFQLARRELTIEHCSKSYLEIYETAQETRSSNSS